MNKILIIGPFPKPISGVSLANEVVKNILEQSEDFHLDTLNTSYNLFEDAVGKFSLRKFFFFLKVNLNFIKVFRNDIIYITPGQTFFGILKYASFICLGSLLKKEMIITECFLLFFYVMKDKKDLFFRNYASSFDAFASFVDET